MRVRLRAVGARGRRRWALTTALAAWAVAGGVVSGASHAESGAQTVPVRVRLAEIARREIFLPLYGALGQGFFRKRGLDVTHKVTLGPDHILAALQEGKADIALGGPDSAINSAIMAGGKIVKIIAAISRWEGSFILSHEKIAPDRFRWESIKGKVLMGWRAGSFPAVFLESALRNRHIDPHSDINYQPNVPYPARMRLWRRGQVDYGTFYLVEAARLEREAAGYPVASVGQAAGPSVYAVFLATADYIRANPDVIQKWAYAVQDALRWTATAPLDDLVATAAKFMPRAAPQDLASAYRRYRPLDMWQTDPTVAPEAIAKVQTMMIDSNVMAPNKRVPYEAVVEPRFAENAKRAAGR